MASRTAKVEHKRALKKKKMGKARKRQDRIHGTTPAFPIHKVKPEPTTE